MSAHQTGSGNVTQNAVYFLLDKSIFIASFKDLNISNEDVL
jgi:hypothetical protein